MDVEKFCKRSSSWGDPTVTYVLTWVTCNPGCYEKANTIWLATSWFYAKVYTQRARVREKSMLSVQSIMLYHVSNGIASLKVFVFTGISCPGWFWCALSLCVTSKCVYIQVSRADAQLRTTERRKTLRITVSVNRFQDPLCPCLDLGSQEDLHLHWLLEKELMVTKDCALRQGTFSIRLGLNAFTHTHSV